MKRIILTPTHVFVSFRDQPKEWLGGGANMARAFVEGARRLAQSGCYVTGGIGGAYEPQVGSLIGWAVLPIETARILACACGVLGSLESQGKEIFGMPMARMHEAQAALEAIVRHVEGYKLGRRKEPNYRRTRRLELLRLAGIKQHGRAGTKTRIYSSPPRWDGCGDPPFAWVDVPDDVREPITARINDRGQLASIIGDEESLHRAAFGSAGSRFSLTRV